MTKRCQVFRTKFLLGPLDLTPPVSPTPPIPHHSLGSITLPFTCPKSCVSSHFRLLCLLFLLPRMFVLPLPCLILRPVCQKVSAHACDNFRVGGFPHIHSYKPLSSWHKLCGTVVQIHVVLVWGYSLGRAPAQDAQGPGFCPQ